jgi:hypothetical protein
MNDEAQLIVFDWRRDVAWDEKIWQRQESFGGRVTALWGA